MDAHLLIPILNVSDIASSFGWFERLGWKKAWDWGEPVVFGCVRSGHCQIFLCEGRQGGRPPTDMPWSVREMHIRHPDGHIFRMSQALPETRA